MKVEKQYNFILILLISIAICCSFCMNSFCNSGSSMSHDVHPFGSLNAVPSFTHEKENEIIKEIQPAGGIHTFVWNVKMETTPSAKSRDLRNTLVSIYFLLSGSIMITGFVLAFIRIRQYRQIPQWRRVLKYIQDADGKKGKIHRLTLRFMNLTEEISLVRKVERKA